MRRKELVILGIRGVPAKHGGFETFAENLCCYLMERDWSITVYCQEYGDGERYVTYWEGIKRVHIPVPHAGAKGTIVFDWKAIVDSLNTDGVHLTLGYNTAVFNILQRIKGIPNVINMDGLEWKRDKWGRAIKIWFWLNERLGCWFGNHLVADHPLIADHLATRVPRSKITMIPYGGKEVLHADESILSNYGLRKDKYAIIVARPEPENSILEIVKAFSQRRRAEKLLILGDYNFKDNDYHANIKQAASSNVVFPGAIYDDTIVSALRFYSRAYIHGHQVGGTNPSLVEALGASNAILAHDNGFNRWVAKNAALYFRDTDAACEALDRIFSDNKLVVSLREKAREVFVSNFTWNDILEQYEQMLLSWLPDH